MIRSDCTPNENLRVGIAIVQALDGQEGRITSEALAEKIGTTPHFVSQIAHKLKRAGLILATKGRTGGMTRNEEKKWLTAADVAAALGYSVPESVEASAWDANSTLQKKILTALREVEL